MRCVGTILFVALLSACDGPVGPVGDAGMPGLDSGRSHVKKLVVQVDQRGWILEDSTYYQKLHVPEITPSVVASGYVQVSTGLPLPTDRRFFEGSRMFLTYTYEENTLTLWGIWGDGANRILQPLMLSVTVTVVSPG